MPQSTVKTDRGVAQAEEQRVASLAELDDVDPPVDRIPPPGKQSVVLHRIEMVGERGLPHAHGVGQFSLTGAGVDLEVEQHQPHGQGTSSLDKSVVEGPAHHPGHPGEMKANGDRHLVRAHNVSLP